MLCSYVRLSLQHPQVLMPRYSKHLHNINPPPKKSIGCHISQVKNLLSTILALPHALRHTSLQRFVMYRKDRMISVYIPTQFSQQLQRVGRNGYIPAVYLRFKLFCLGRASYPTCYIVRHFFFYSLKSMMVEWSTFTTISETL